MTIIKFTKLDSPYSSQKKRPRSFKLGLCPYRNVKMSLVKGELDSPVSKVM